MKYFKYEGGKMVEATEEVKTLKARNKEMDKALKKLLKEAEDDGEGWAPNMKRSRVLAIIDDVV